MSWNTDTPGAAPSHGDAKVLGNLRLGPLLRTPVTIMGKTDLVLSAALQDPPHARFLLLLPRLPERAELPPGAGTSPGLQSARISPILEK